MSDDMYTADPLPVPVLTFAKIVTESGARCAERGFDRHERLDIARDQWDAMYMASCAIRRYGTSGPYDYDAPFVFQGPSGRITVRPDDTLPAGTWKWREPSPFERWFPTHEGV